MYNCVERGKQRLEAELENRRCKAREVLSRDIGGTDYSAPCKQFKNNAGRHKGNHITEDGYTWEPSIYDVWID